MVTFASLNDEFWWGGAIDIGALSPLGAKPVTRDLADPGKLADGQPYPSSQSAPILISTRGRTLTSDQPFAYQFEGNRVSVDDLAQLARPGANLAQAYRAAMGEHFPPSGAHPALELMENPQYNTWIEMPYVPTQEKVLAYVDSILDAGLPPGVLFIDDNWAPEYGDWIFDSRRFPDPKKMLQELHQRGFRVVLWLVPFISPDSPQFRELERAGFLLRNEDGDTAIRRWWNGFSAVLDITNPNAAKWLRDRLDALMDLGVDGFKYDAGDVGFYRPQDQSYAGASPVEHCQAWAEFGLATPFNEYRACWKMGGQALGQRLRDKPPQWGSEGIESLIPEVLGQAMIGHYYTCPDMIGGGEVGACSEQNAIDQEFVVRYAQVAALMPMMQFSMNPARILDAEHLQMVRDLLRMRSQFTPLILDLAKQASQTGEPIVRPMAFHCTDPQAAPINDQFFLGPDVVVAPQVKPGATSRRVFLPAGTWVSDRNETVEIPSQSHPATGAAPSLGTADSGCTGVPLSSPDNAMDSAPAGSIPTDAEHGDWIDVDTPLERLVFFTLQR